MSWEERILIEDVVEVRDFPLVSHLVVHREQLKEIKPAYLGLKPDNILHRLSVIAAEQNRRKVLILNEELHWRLDQTSHRDEIRLVAVIKVVQEVPLVVLRSADSHGRSVELSVGNAVLFHRVVVRPVDVEAFVDLDLEDVDARLLDRQVRHLDVQSVEVNAVHTLGDVVGEVLLADDVQTLDVGDSGVLVELAEEVIEVNDAHGVVDELVPVRRVADWDVLVLVVLNDFLEVPGEGEDVAVLRLRKLAVNADAGVARLKALFFLRNGIDFASGESTESGCG